MSITDEKFRYEVAWNEKNKWRQKAYPQETQASIMKWQRPTLRNRTCEKCGVFAEMEFTQTIQCEPADGAIWHPRCTRCGPPEINRKLAWAYSAIGFGK